MILNCIACTVMSENINSVMLANSTAVPQQNQIS